MFIHIAALMYTSDVNINLSRYDDWEIFQLMDLSLDYYLFSKCCQCHLTSLKYFSTAPILMSCTAAFNNASLTPTLTSILHLTHACMLRADNFFNTFCIILNLSALTCETELNKLTYLVDRFCKLTIFHHISIE